MAGLLEMVQKLRNDADAIITAITTGGGAAASPGPRRRGRPPNQTTTSVQRVTTAGGKLTRAELPAWLNTLANGATRAEVYERLGYKPNAPASTLNSEFKSGAIVQRDNRIYAGPSAPMQQAATG